MRMIKRDIKRRDNVEVTNMILKLIKAKIRGHYKVFNKGNKLWITQDSLSTARFAINESFEEVNNQKNSKDDAEYPNNDDKIPCLQTLPMGNKITQRLHIFKSSKKMKNW